MIKRGALIVFEGCDRSGKTTQCQKAMNWFQQTNKPAHFMRFPGVTDFKVSSKIVSLTVVINVFDL